MKYLLPIFLSMVSCTPNEEKIDYLTKRWGAIDKVEYQHDSIAQSIDIRKPQNTWQRILSVGVDTIKGIEIDCLYYYIPSKHQKGQLKILTALADKSCDESFYQKPFIGLKGVNQFSYKINSKKLQLSINKIHYDFKFINTTMDMGKIIASTHGKYQSPPVDGQTCFKQDSKCKNIINNCELCPNGFYEIIDSDCNNGGTRICGSKQCGLKGEHACSRGKTYVGNTQGFCIQDSPMGICEERSRVMCIEGVLICD